VTPSPGDSANRRIVSPDVLVSHLAGEAVLLNLQDKRYYRLNETAAFIWKGLERGDAPESIAAGLASEFETVHTDARAAVDRQISEFEERGFLK
jgi:hypothetical protein